MLIYSPYIRIKQTNIGKLAYTKKRRKRDRYNQCINAGIVLGLLVTDWSCEEGNRCATLVKLKAVDPISSI